MRRPFLLLALVPCLGLTAAPLGHAGAPCVSRRAHSVPAAYAAAVALLYEQGKLDLDAPVQRYVPAFPTKPYPITTRELAGHLAGIRHYRGDEFRLNRHFDTVVEGLSIFEDDSLLFPPGTKFSYSSYGWNLISAVVEGASGETFLRYISDHVFRPLGMTRTAPDRVDSLIPHRTQ